MHGEDLASTYASAADRIARWAWRGPGSHPDILEEPSGHRPEVNGYRLSWTEFAPDDRSERALEVVLRHPDPQVAGREWRSVVDLCLTKSCVSATFRVSREAIELRMTPAAVTTLRRPGIVAELLNTDPCTAGDLDVTATAAPLHVTGVEDFVSDRLRSAGRALPVVVVAPPVGGRDDPDPARVADELAGLAHVVTLGGHLAMRRFQNAVGDFYRVPPGGLRLFWPGFGEESDRLRHRYWTRRAIVEDSAPIHRTLFALLSRVSVHAVPRDPLPTELRRVVAEQRVRKLVAEGHSDAELLEVYAAENDELRQKVAELEAMLLDHAAELAAHRKNWEAISGASYVEEDTTEQDALEAESEFEPQSWTEFADYLPALETDAFVITPRAKEACNPSPYPNPARMWSHLERLSEAANAWAAQDCSVGTDLKTWIEQNYDGLEIALFDDSLGARATFEFQGKLYSREPHVKVDDYKSPAECGRIYFAHVAEERRFIVDHIGLHL